MQLEHQQRRTDEHAQRAEPDRGQRRSERGDEHCERRRRSARPGEDTLGAEVRSRPHFTGPEV